jgi:hypothetical protein
VRKLPILPQKKKKNNNNNNTVKCKKAESLSPKKSEKFSAPVPPKTGKTSI